MDLIETRDLLPPGPGNPARRLLKAAGGRHALLYLYAVAALVNDRRAAGATFAEIAGEFEHAGIKTFRGHTFTPAYLGQQARAMPRATLDNAAILAARHEGEKNHDETE